MDVDVIRQKREELRDKMFAAIKTFMDDTGCVPDIVIDYHVIERIGTTRGHVPRVNIEVRI